MFCCVAITHGSHLPPVHVPPRQLWPHAPQFAASLVGLMHVPEHPMSGGVHWHDPLLQVMFAPQFFVFDAIGLSHVCELGPVVVQVPAMWQMSLAWHATAVPEHVPFWHASFCVQPLPSSQAFETCTAPMSTHTETPVEHEVSPVWHCIPVGVHTTFAAHMTHLPPLQT
jgi:hypothetical protein